MADSIKFKQDVVQMKEYVYNIKNYENKTDILSEIEKFLIENENDIFYLLKDDNKLFPCENKNHNYILVTHNEMIQKITTGIDINKISYSGGEIPDIIDKPQYYREVQGNTKFFFELCYRYKNFKFVDNKLLKYSLRNLYFNQ